MSFEFINGSVIDVVVPTNPPVLLPPVETSETAVILVQGPPGPTGPAGGDTLIHNQNTPSANWNVVHNFGRFPNILVKVDGERVLTDVADASVNEVVVTFAEPKTGSVYLN